jgi:hypothetical protein
MSGSELDALVDDQKALEKAALDNFDPDTEIQIEDDDPTDDEEQKA